MMSQPSLPAELCRFLIESIDSISQLEAILLLRGSRQVTWRVPHVAQRLYIGEREATEVLQHLTNRGLLTLHEEGYRYWPLNAGDAQMVDLLAEHYRSQLIPITKIVHEKPPRVQQFSDAFKMKRD